MRQWMRENKGVLLGMAAAVLLLGWLAAPAIRSLVQQRAGTTGKIRGEKIGPRELQSAARAVRALQMLSPAAGQVGPVIYGMIRSGQEIQREDAWRYLVLLYEARKAGVKVTQQEVKNALASVPALSGENGFDTDRYRMLLRRMGMSDQQLRSVLSDFLKITKLVSLKLESIPVPENEVWMDYAYRHRQARVRFVELDPSLFTSRVEVSEEDLRNFYEEHKNTVANPGSSKVGYKAPRRAKVACAVADYGEYEEKVEVTDEDIRNYYEENKDDFVVEENGDSDANSGADSEEGGNGNSEGNAGDEADGSDAADQQNDEQASDGNEPSDEAQAGNTEEGQEEGTEDEKEYKPLSEVRDQIKQTLTSQKAKEAAHEAASSVLEDLQSVSSRYVNAALPLQQMARRHDVGYRVLQNDEGRSYLSQQELSQLVPGSGNLATFAMDETLYSPEKFEGQDAARVCQVLDRKEPRVLPFDEVKERVTQDYRRSRALDAARKFGEKLAAQARQSSLQEAANSLADTVPGPETGSSDESNEQQDDGAENNTEDAPLQLQETSYFRRGSPFVPEMGGPQPEVVNKAFELDDDQMAVVVDGQQQENCYVIQKMDEKAAATDSYYRMKPMLSGWRRWLGMLSSPQARRFAGRMLQQNYVLRRKIGALRDWMDDLEAAAELGEAPKAKEKSKG